MPALTQLRHAALKARARLERARSAYRSAACRYLIAELLNVIAKTPEIATLHLSADYAYDDEGGYFRRLSGCVTLAPDALDGDELDDYWTEGLDVEQEVILELFGIDDVGEGSLTRGQLEALAVGDAQDEGGQ